jgi:type II secretory pathway pseudopilin PulG
MRRSSQSGFTLVELVIAIGLMLIITLQLSLVFNSARAIVTAADAMVQVYENARAALDIMERDIANIQKTSQMEFFKDNKTRSDFGIGIYNENHNEELRGQQGINPRFFDGVDYIYALSLKQKPPYQPADRKAGGPYRRDSIYFRTMTTIDGKPKETLVQYELYTGATEASPLPRPILRRTLWEIDRVDTEGVPQVKKHDPEDICYYVEEFKVEAFLRDKRKRGVGRFYSPKEATAGNAPAGDPTPPNLFRYGAGDLYGIMCVSKSGPADNAYIDSSDGSLVIPNDRIPMVAAGDFVYIQTKENPGVPALRLKQDFGGPLKVGKIQIMEQGTRVWFDQSPYIALQVAPLLKQGMTQVPCDWRAGWLPPALRITMKIKDERSQEVRTIQRIFQILRT